MEIYLQRKEYVNMTSERKGSKLPSSEVGVSGECRDIRVVL